MALAWPAVVGGAVIRGAVICGAVIGGTVGCGEAPEPPTAITPAERVGAGSKGQTESNVLEVRPSPDAVMQAPPPAAVADAGPKLETVPAAAEPAARPPAAAAKVVVSACRETRVAGCDGLYVRSVQTSPPLCVQLALDNCNENTRAGLTVNIPLSWRLSSGAASSDVQCSISEYDPKSEPALTGTGTITFDEQNRQISGLNVDVRLRIAVSQTDLTLPTDVSVVTTEPIGAIPLCED